MKWCALFLINTGQVCFLFLIFCTLVRGDIVTMRNKVYAWDTGPLPDPCRTCRAFLDRPPTTGNLKKQEACVCTGVCKARFISQNPRGRADPSLSLRAVCSHLRFSSCVKMTADPPSIRVTWWSMLMIWFSCSCSQFLCNMLDKLYRSRRFM